MEPLDVLEEPGPAAGRRDRGEVPGRRAGASRGEAAAVDGALLGGRHADRGLGLDEERSSRRTAVDRRPAGLLVAGATRRPTSGARSVRTQTQPRTTDPDAMLYRKGPGMEAKLCFIGHALMENRAGSVVDARLTRVSGHAERLAALDMIGPRAERPVRRSRWAPTRATMPPTSSMELREINVHTARRAEHQRPSARRSTGGRPAIPAMPRASASASGSRRASAGSRPSPACEDQAIAASRRSDGPSPSPPRPTIWSGCRGFWRERPP